MRLLVSVPDQPASFCLTASAPLALPAPSAEPL